MENKELIFIYNADGDFWSQAKDLTKKISGKSTGCSLCNATWAVFDKKKYWSEKEKKLKIPYQYLHRNILTEETKGFMTKNNIQLPTVLLKKDDNYHELINKDQLDKCSGDESCVWNLLKKQEVAQD